MPGDTYDIPPHGWTCFHCGETFMTVGSARDHFGYTQFADPGCIIDKVAVEEGGKPERGRGLLMALRKAEAELERYREEDTDLHRALHTKDCERNTAVMRAEEQGYARGLRDGVNLPFNAPEYPTLARTPQQFPYDRTFRAIAASTSSQSPGVAINVSVQAFADAWNAYGVPVVTPAADPQRNEGGA